ncbi:MAG: hypothetical protein ACRD2J_05055 [Thermoanaerobaculia bacterium]
MTFYLNRTLASGAIRFSVGERTSDPHAGAEGLSTGASGEYLHLRNEALFFSDAGERQRGELDALGAVAKREDMLIPFWGWLCVGFGALLLVLGPLVVMNKGYMSGWVEAGAGVALIALPFVVTLKKRREARVRRTRELAEMEAAERELRQTAGAFIDRVAALRSANDETALDPVRRAREAREIPYERTRPAACAAVRRVGFDAFAAGDADPRRVARAIDLAADACGLTEEDARAIRLSIVQKAWWHLLADDRLSPARRARLEELREALGIPENDVATERRAADEFERLQGVGPRSLPKAECRVRLRPLETCVHVTHGSVTEPRVRRVLEADGTRRREEHWEERPEEEVTVTTQRVVATDGKKFEIDVRSLWDVEVDADLGIIALVEGGPRRRARYLRVPDAIYTAGVIQAAATAPLKPKGLV